jgi:hypothetical protein
MEIVIFAVMFFLSLVGFQLSLWILFEHNNVEGWKSLIPFYNLFLLQTISKVDSQKYWMWFVPGVNFYLLYECNKSLCKKYEKSDEMAWGMTLCFWAFYPLLAIDVVSWMEKSLYETFCGPLPFYGPAQFQTQAEKQAA